MGGGVGRLLDVRSRCEQARDGGADMNSALLRRDEDVVTNICLQRESSTGGLQDPYVLRGM